MNDLFAIHLLLTIINYISRTIENKELINSVLKNNGLNLTLSGKNNKEYTYYCYTEFPKEIMLTLVYHSLWDYNTNGCRINVYLELQGSIKDYVEKNMGLLKEKRIEPNLNLAHKKKLVAFPRIHNTVYSQ